MMSGPFPHIELTSNQISVAAEAFTTAQFALAGFDVLTLPDRTSRFSNLDVAGSCGTMKISVWASLNGFWDLADEYLDPSESTNASAVDFHRAIDLWLDGQSSQDACCLVQFEPADLHCMPRLHLASPDDVAERLHEMIDQVSNDKSEPLGHDMVRPLEGLPVPWRLSPARIADLLEPIKKEEASLDDQIIAAFGCEECAESQPVACAKCLPLMTD